MVSGRTRQGTDSESLDSRSLTLGLYLSFLILFKFYSLFLALGMEPRDTLPQNYIPSPF